MTREDEFIGQLEAYLDEYEGMTPLPGSTRDAVRAELPTTRQIGPVTGLMRDIYMNSSMDTPARWGLVAAVVVGAAIIGGALILGGGGVGQPPSESNPPASTSPNASRSDSELPRAEQPLQPGTYFLAGFPVPIRFDVTEGFRSCSSGSLEQAVCTEIDGNSGNPGLVFLVIDNVVADPCDPNEELLDPAVGPTVDDLVAALSALPGFEVTAPEDVTISGFSGKRLQLTAPTDRGDCDLSTWAVDGAVNAVGPGEVNDLRILDVNGERVVITTAYFADTEDLVPAVEQIVDSIQIE